MPATLRVLYVDDDTSLLDIGKLFLEESGDFNVATAISAPEGIRLLEQEKFDAIVSDYQMPGMDGIQFLIEVRSRFGPIPFILFTGKGREEVVIQAINSGADFYLQKGGEPHAQFAELSHKIKSAVSRKRVDDSLRESELKYRSLFDNAILGIFRTTPEGRYLDMNAAFARIAGYDSPEEMKAAIHDIGKQLYVRPEDRQKIGKLLTLNGVIRNFETEIRHQDGHPIWISINATNVRSENGSVLWWDGTIEDITARKVAEQALQESEANYLQVINTMDETLSVIDPDGNFLFVNNNAALNLSGGTPEDVTAKNIREFVPSEAEQLIEKYRSVVASGQPVKGDIRISLKSGERWFSNVLQPIHYGQTKVPAVLSISLDITERKRAEMALQDSNELFTQFIRHSPFYTYIKTMTANESRILYVSDTYNPMTGLSGRDMVGKNPTELLPAEVAAKVTADDWAVISNGTVQELIREYGGRHYNILKFPIVQRDKIFLAGYTIDITERKQAEYALRESEALLSDIIEKNPMSIQIVDREGFTLRVNPAFMRLFGSVPPPDYSIITDLVKSRPELENLISQVKSGEAVNLPDMSFNPHDIYPELPDVPTRVRAIIFPLNDRYGNPERFVFMHENITGQKQAEEALQGSRRILETIIDNVPSRVFWKDTNLTYLGCNTAFARDAGFEKPEDVIGKDDFAMGWHNQAELYRADDRHVIESGSAKLFIEEPQTTPSGEEISLLTSKVPLRNETGNIIGVLGTYLDVTERKQAAEVLKDSEASYRGLFNAIQQALYLLDRQGKFVDINAGAEKMYGYTREEFVGRTPEFLSAPGKNDLGAVAEKIQKAFGGEPQQFGFWGLRKNREEFPKDVYLYKATYFGEDVVLAIGIDITDRRQAEEALRQANRKLNLLSGITRHDITNQLSIIQGYIGILEKKQLDPTLAVYFQKVSTAAERISAMIRFTKEYESIGMNAPAWQGCHTLVETAAMEIQLGEISVVNDLPSGSEVFADPLIVKVFYNLMDNAVRYGGKITTIRFSVEEAGEDHLIICEDDGVGVVAGEKEKIFESGFGKNTGLGLFLSREILEITGIPIKETGEPGKGARFEMTVPKGMYR